MIPHGVEIFIGVESIDLRWGFERLSGLVTERIGRSARSGALFVFRGRRGDAMKVLFLYPVHGPRLSRVIAAEHDARDGQ